MGDFVEQRPLNGLSPDRNDEIHEDTKLSNFPPNELAETEGQRRIKAANEKTTALRTAVQDRTSTDLEAEDRRAVEELASLLELRNANGATLSGEEMYRLMDIIQQPLSLPSRTDDPYLSQTYRQLTVLQSTVLTDQEGIESYIRDLCEGKPVNRANIKELTVDIYLYITKLTEYIKANTGEHPQDPAYQRIIDFFKGFGTLEGLQNAYRGARTAIQKQVNRPQERAFGPTEQKQVDTIVQNIEKKLGSKLPEFSKVEAQLRSTLSRDIGSEFLEAFKHLNAVDYVLFCYTMYASENKTQAAAEFATVIAGCAASDLLLLKAEQTLIRMAAVSEGVQGARLLSLAKIPGHPIVKLTVVLGGLCFGHSYIKSSVEHIKDFIPGTIRDQVGTPLEGVFHTLSLGPVWDEIGSKNAEAEGYQLRSMDARIRELARPRGIALKLGGTLFSESGTLYAWNRSVERSMATMTSAEDRKMAELETYDFLRNMDEKSAQALYDNADAWRKAWMESASLQREAAALLPKVASLRRDTATLTNLLQEKGLESKVPDLANFVLSERHTVWKRPRTGEPDGAASYPSQLTAFERALLGTYEPESGIATLGERIAKSKDTQLQEFWTSLVKQAKDIATHVSVLRYNDVYEASSWFGSEEAAGYEPTPFAREGMSAEIVYRFRQREIVPFTGQRLAMDIRNDRKSALGATKILEEATDINGMIALIQNRKILHNQEGTEQLRHQLENAILQGVETLKSVGTLPSVTPRIHSEVDTILRPVQEITSQYQARGTLSVSALRIVQKSLAEASLLCTESQRSLKETTGKIPSGGPIYSTGIDNALSAQFVQQAFGNSQTWSPADIVIVDCTPPPANLFAARTIIHCPTANTLNWTVTIDMAQQVTNRGTSGIMRTPRKVLPIDSWRSAHPDRASVLDPLLTQLLEQRTNENETRRQNSERSKLALEEQLNANQNILISTGKDSQGREYRIQVATDKEQGTRTLIFKDTKDAESIGKIPNAGMQKAPPPSQIIDSNTGEATFIRQEDIQDRLMAPQKLKLARIVLTAPISDDPRASIEKIIRIFPYELRANWMGKINENTALTLTNSLLPLYNEASYEKRGFFLNELLSLLLAKKSINKEVSNETIRWFERHKTLFS